jgi:hypothetical protein
MRVRTSAFPHEPLTRPCSQTNKFWYMLKHLALEFYGTKQRLVLQL